MDDREDFRRILGELHSLKQQVARKERELDQVVDRIAAETGMTKQACLQDLLQKIVDEDSRELPGEPE